MQVNDLYYNKYLKYKNKYLNLSSQIGGVIIDPSEKEKPNIKNLFDMMKTTQMTKALIDILDTARLQNEKIVTIQSYISQDYDDIPTGIINSVYTNPKNFNTMITKSEEMINDIKQLENVIEMTIVVNAVLADVEKLTQSEQKKKLKLNISIVVEDEKKKVGRLKKELDALNNVKDQDSTASLLEASYNVLMKKNSLEQKIQILSNEIKPLIETFNDLIVKAEVLFFKNKTEEEVLKYANRKKIKLFTTPFQRAAARMPDAIIGDLTHLFYQYYILSLRNDISRRTQFPIVHTLDHYNLNPFLKDGLKDVKKYNITYEEFIINLVEKIRSIQSSGIKDSKEPKIEWIALVNFLLYQMFDDFFDNRMIIQIIENLINANNEYIINFQIPLISKLEKEILNQKLKDIIIMLRSNPSYLFYDKIKKSADEVNYKILDAMTDEDMLKLADKEVIPLSKIQDLKAARNKSAANLSQSSSSKMTAVFGDGTDRKSEMTAVFGDGTNQAWIDAEVQLLDKMTEEEALKYAKSQGITLMSNPAQRAKAIEERKELDSYL